jgi:hypothetical protein
LNNFPPQDTWSEKKINPEGENPKKKSKVAIKGRKKNHTLPFSSEEKSELSLCR